MNQYQAGVSRIVLDLTSPVQYTWDALGNRLNIRIRADEAATAKAPTVPAMTPGTEPVAVPVASGSTGTRGGSCATSKLTSLGYAATSASAVTAPPWSIFQTEASSGHMATSPSAPDLVISA